LMPRFPRVNVLQLFGLATILSALSSPANASPSWTLTDLNAGLGGGFPRYVTNEANGDVFVTVDNTTAYAFPHVDTVQLNPRAAGFPVYDPMLPAAANQTVANNVLYGLQNANGVVAAMSATAVETWNGPTFVNSQSLSQSVYAVSKNPDGSW